MFSTLCGLKNLSQVLDKIRLAKICKTNLYHGPWEKVMLLKWEICKPNIRMEQGPTKKIQSTNF
jgi:hypothetical protein